MSKLDLAPMPLKAGCVKDAGKTMGRGIFATRLIEEGEIIEICPIIKLVTPFRDLSIEVKHVCFDWAHLSQEDGIQALVLGYGSLYNHANPSNASYSAEGGQFLVISAARMINADEQITINYNFSSGGTTSTDDNWFQSRDIEVHSI